MKKFNLKFLVVVFGTLGNAEEVLLERGTRTSPGSRSHRSSRSKILEALRNKSSLDSLTKTCKVGPELFGLWSVRAGLRVS